MPRSPIHGLEWENYTLMKDFYIKTFYYSLFYEKMKFSTGDIYEYFSQKPSCPSKPVSTTDFLPAQNEIYKTFWI